MDAVLFASAQDLIRRLRLAGDEHSELRCMLVHSIDTDIAYIDRTFGGIHGDCMFVPMLDVRDYWHLFYYFATDKDRASVSYLLGPKPGSDEEIEYQQATQNKWRRLRVKLKSLLDDAYWLTYSLGFSNIPGLSTFNTNKLLQNESVWIWMLFHAAWERPAGTILRAPKYYPEQWVVRDEIRKKQEQAVGVDSKKGGLKNYQQAKKAVREHNRQLTREQRAAEWGEVYHRVASEASVRLNEGQYVSTLPLDPFTASAALIEWLVVMHDRFGANERPQTLSEVANESRSPPLTKTELARRITGQKYARPRDVQLQFAQYGLKHVGGKKWTVCLDLMDAATRRRVEGVG